VGFLPVFSPPERCLGHAPVHTQPAPVDAFQAVVLEQTLLPELEEDARFNPPLEAVVGGGTRAELGGIESLPLTAGAQDIEDSIGTDAVGGAGSSSAEAMGVHMVGDEDLHEFPEFIGDAPVLGDVGRIHEGVSCARMRQLQKL
jgi:hypothetical protein